MALYLRKVEPSREAYRVILKDGVTETEIGSIGLQHETGAVTRWAWAIDTVIPMRESEQMGNGVDRKDCQVKFKAAWEKFAADPARLADFMRMRRQRLP